MSTPIVKKYCITLVSGLHIGGSNAWLKIGGIDASVVKHPLTDEPYIPGSSIKGKMRALIEMTEYASELVQTEFKPVNNETTQIAQYFGASKDEGGIPAKILFDDFMLTEERKNTFEERKSDFYEDKAENSVPRFFKWSANPRHIERVPAGVQFQGNIVLTPYEDTEIDCSAQALEKFLEKGIALLESNYLGKGGSRGNGRIKFELLQD